MSSSFMTNSPCAQTSDEHDAPMDLATPEPTRPSLVPGGVMDELADGPKTSPVATMPPTPRRSVSCQGPDDVDDVCSEDSPSTCLDFFTISASVRGGRYKENQTAGQRIQYFRSGSSSSLSGLVALSVKRSAENLTGQQDLDIPNSTIMDLQNSDKLHDFRFARCDISPLARKQRKESLLEATRPVLHENTLHGQPSDVGGTGVPLDSSAKNYGMGLSTPYKHPNDSTPSSVQQSNGSPHVIIQEPLPGINVVGGDPSVTGITSLAASACEVKRIYDFCRSRDPFKTPKAPVIAQPSALRPLTTVDEKLKILGDLAVPLSPMPVALKNKRRITPLSFELARYSHPRRRISGCSDSSFLSASPLTPTHNVAAVQKAKGAKGVLSEKQFSHEDWVHFEDAFSMTGSPQSAQGSPMVRRSTLLSAGSNSSILERYQDSLLDSVSVEDLVVPVGYKLGYRHLLPSADTRIFSDGIIIPAEYGGNDTTPYEVDFAAASPNSDEPPDPDTFHNSEDSNGNTPDSLSTSHPYGLGIDNYDSIQINRSTITNKNRNKTRINVWEDGWVYTGSSKESKAKDLLWSLIPISQDPDIVLADIEYQKLRKAPRSESEKGHTSRIGTQE